MLLLDLRWKYFLVSGKEMIAEDPKDTQLVIADPGWMMRDDADCGREMIGSFIILPKVLRINSAETAIQYRQCTAYK